ncbi:MAG: hypothetical protein JO152_14750 [Mycobacteriaceae bacterium]|nr:hypothetical protein [Mycobacteriaceae bacterium]
MQTFGLRRTGWWVTRAFGGNPLLRKTDRIEALVIVTALIVALAVLPIAGAVGTAVYGSRVQLYAEQAQTRHRLAATVIEAAPGKGAPHATASAARVAWMIGGRVRTDWLSTDHPAKPGDRLDVWVTDSGDEAAPPTPTSKAVIDAVGVSTGIWLVVVLVLRLLVALGRSPLNRIRQAQWEREITRLNGGGRTNRPQ